MISEEDPVDQEIFSSLISQIQSGLFKDSPASGHVSLRKWVAFSLPQIYIPFILANLSFIQQE
jgi:hypothetical protein